MSVIVPSLAEKNPHVINTAIQQLAIGRSNATSSFTLTANATSTVVTSATCGPNSIILWSPKTANAATQMTTLYCASVGLGTFTLTHASSVNTDQTFNYIALG